MTLRLVALISVVLLLSLAAFGLLMGYYQNQMVQVVADTASDVGRATLRALDLGEHEILLEGRARNVFSWSSQGQGPGATYEMTTDAEIVGEFDQGVVVTQIGDPDEVRQRVRTIERILTHPGAHPDRIAVQGPISAECVAEAAADAGEDAAPGLSDCLEAQMHVVQAEAGSFFIDVEDAHVRGDAQHGLVMTITTLTPTSEDSPEALTELAEQTANVMLTKEQLHLPIGLEKYSELARKVRGRSLALFLGVFAVGMVLSTGLATRFTRPIRKLDAGIRRLSEGDLDVRVEEGGKDEIGRLSRAFNEMAGKLAASRDQGRELMRREKLSALGRMAAGVAHDVRNPLHSIGLTLQHLRETARPGEDERAAEFDRSLEIIRGEIHRLDKVVGSFLTFARSEQGEREEIDLGTLLRETERLVQKEAERRNVELSLEIDPATPRVLADAEALRSSVLNLVLNSFEAMPDGGTLVLSLAAEEERVVIEISDSGEGIPEEHQEHVFDFAYTTKEGGNGLGLAMVHHCVVESHGGQVSLVSEPGEGTRVRMALPMRAKEDGGADQ
jgi:signal transduction histidine kinase